MEFYRQFKNLTDLTMFPIFYSVEVIIILFYTITKSYFYLQSGTIPSDLATKLKLDLYSLMYGSEALMFLLIGITGKTIYVKENDKKALA